MYAVMKSAPDDTPRLTDRKHGRNQHRAWMCVRRMVGVVVVDRMRERAMEQRRVHRRGFSPGSDQRHATVAFGTTLDTTAATGSASPAKMHPMQSTIASAARIRANSGKSKIRPGCKLSELLGGREREEHGKDRCSK